jgi:hypothetical protein
MRRRRALLFFPILLIMIFVLILIAIRWRWLLWRF